MRYAPKIVIAGFAVFLILISASCGNKKGSARADSLIVISSDSPASLDPTLTNDGASVEIMKQVYETLFIQDFDTMIPMPNLAERYQFENDANGQPTRLRLFLKQGVKFHNGETFKASDVKFSLERAKASPVISHITGAIANVDIVNDYEVVLNMEYPFAPILNNLAFTALSITNEKAVLEGGESYPRNPVGTGALKFVKWIAGNRIELTRWDEYYGEVSKLKDVTVRYIAEPATAILEVETGGADIYIHLANQPSDIERLQSNPDVQVIRALWPSISYIGFNDLKHPFDDVRVRRAILYAVDNESLVKNVFHGIGVPGKGPLPSRVWAAAGDALEQYDYNPEKARQLLAEAGYPNGFSTSILIYGMPAYIDAATVVSNMLAQVGITVDVKIVELPTHLEMTGNGEHEMFILAWTTVTGDPDYGLELFHTRSFGAGGNRSFYSNLEVDRLLDAGRMETNLERRAQIYLEAQKLIHADAPWIYLTEGETIVLARSNIRGFDLNRRYRTVYFEQDE